MILVFKKKAACLRGLRLLHLHRVAIGPLHLQGTCTPASKGCAETWHCAAPCVQASATVKCAARLHLELRVRLAKGLAWLVQRLNVPRTSDSGRVG